MDIGWGWFRAQEHNFWLSGRGSKIFKRLRKKKSRMVLHGNGCIFCFVFFWFLFFFFCPIIHNRWLIICVACGVFCHQWQGLFGWVVVVKVVTRWWFITLSSLHHAYVISLHHACIIFCILNSFIYCTWWSHKILLLWLGLNP